MGSESVVSPELLLTSLDRMEAGVGQDFIIERPSRVSEVGDDIGSGYIDLLQVGTVVSNL